MTSEKKRIAGSRPQKLRNSPATRPAPCISKPAAFESNDAVLDAALHVFLARQELVKAPDKRARGQEARKEAALVESWHRSYGLTGDQVSLCAKFREAKLDQIEREILCALLLQTLAMTNLSLDNCGAVLEFMGLAGAPALEALRKFSEGAPLRAMGLVRCLGDDENLRERNYYADPALVGMVLLKKGQVEPGWPVETDEELYKALRPLTRAFADLAPEYQWYRPNRAGRHLKVERLYRELRQTLQVKPTLGLNGLLAMVEEAEPRIGQTLVILLGRELGHLPADHSLFSGSGIAQATRRNGDDDWHLDDALCGLLGTNAVLVREGLIQPCDGMAGLLSNDPRELGDVKYELSERSISLLKLDERRVKKRYGKEGVRPARVRPDQLVLSDRVRKALEMAMAQSRNSGLLLQTWGLGEAIAYGRAVTLLFSGTPGTGKTACAEALAHELKRPILVADYSEVQDCYVGGTERNIVRVFTRARQSGAVLFWDEADAMFYDRDFSARTWEVRDVNVLLQELEKFEGVCVLATNRKVSLDPALERRISMKVEFERPDQEMREQIWRRLIPEKLPLAPDIDLARLAEAALSGGEIKNVVLNAARMAAVRGPDAVVQATDFQEALEMETGGKWSKAPGERAGYCLGARR